MNLVLLFPEDFDGGGLSHAVLRDRRRDHISRVHRAKVGDVLRVGLADGPTGEAIVRSVTEDEVRLDVALVAEPPRPLPLRLVIALPRPKVLNRVVAATASLGVKELYFINAWKVEKSYWGSPRLDEKNLLQQSIIGLEQGVDTVMPRIELRRFFRTFVEEELPAISHGTLRLVAHPNVRKECPRDVGREVTLVIGPEGGFIPDEVTLLESFDFMPVSIGERVLRVETAVAALIARLF